jgi:hypothetical protein
MMAVRRALSISLLLILSLPLVSSLFATRTAGSTLPACCRRSGTHHCAMLSEDDGSGEHAVRARCPYTPGASAVLLLPSFAPSTAASIFAGITRHPAISPQTAAQLRISFDRARQKRGPPALLV